MLLAEYTRRELLFSIAGDDRDGGLGDDRSMVERSRYEVHRAAVNAYSSLQGTAVRVEARESRQQGRMDVQHAATIAPHERLRQHAHETCKDDEIRRVTIDFAREGGIEFGSISVAVVVDDSSRNAVSPCSRKAAHIGDIADYGCYRCRQA
jgi:hypothetical protein